MDIPEISPLQNLIVVGDRLLIEPLPGQDKTRGGLYLPATVKAKDEVRTGRIIKCGPGYALPADKDPDDFIKGEKDSIRYVPLQASEGDLAVYLQKQAWEVEYSGKKLVIVPQNAVLLLVRDELAELDIH